MENRERKVPRQRELKANRVIKVKEEKKATKAKTVLQVQKERRVTKA